MRPTLRRKLSRLVEAVFPQPLEYWRRRRYLRAIVRRERFWNAQERGGKIIHHLQPGVSLNLYLDSELCRHIYIKDFEAEERRFVNLFLRPGDVFVDVGANIGLFTVLAGRLVGEQGQVFAFEPCRSTFARLEENIRLNALGNVHRSQIALSDSTGEMDMVVSAEGLDAWNSFARPYVGAEFTTEKVTVNTWDAFATKHPFVGRVAMIKIDVEGWEERVLLGMREECSRPDAPVLQVEFTDAAAAAAGLSCRAVYKLLHEFGYEVCHFDQSTCRLVPEELRAAYPYCNLFAVKNRTAVQSRLHQRLAELSNE